MIRLKKDLFSQNNIILTLPGRDNTYFFERHCLLLFKAHKIKQNCLQSQTHCLGLFFASAPFCVVASIRERRHTDTNSRYY